MNKKSNNKSNFLYILVLMILFLMPILVKHMVSNDLSNEILEKTTYENKVDSTTIKDNIKSKIDINTIPDYSGEPCIVVNNNIPYFKDSDLTIKSYETYGELDSLGRCTTAIACIGQDLMPTEKRESISKVKPTRME